MYEAYFLEKRFIGQNLSMNVVPELMQELEQLQMGLDEVKEEMIEPKISSCCVVMGCINIVLVVFGILLYVLK